MKDTTEFKFKLICVSDSGDEIEPIFEPYFKVQPDPNKPFYNPLPQYELVNGWHKNEYHVLPANPHSLPKSKHHE